MEWTCAKQFLAVTLKKALSVSNVYGKNIFLSIILI